MSPGHRRSLEQAASIGPHMCPLQAGHADPVVCRCHAQHLWVGWTLCILYFILVRRKILDWKSWGVLGALMFGLPAVPFGVLTAYGSSDGLGDVSPTCVCSSQMGSSMGVRCVLFTWCPSASIVFGAEAASEITYGTTYSESSSKVGSCIRRGEPRSGGG